MEVLKFSLISVFLLSSCTIAAQNKNFKMNNNVNDCFEIVNTEPEYNGESVFLRAFINIKTEDGKCPCKSALMQYMAFQMNEGQEFNLITGNFSILNKENILLPVAIQKQLIFPEIPIQIKFSCSSQ